VDCETGTLKYLSVHENLINRMIVFSGLIL